MRAAPPPPEWEAPIEDTSLTAWLGTDQHWHLCVDAPGWSPYVASACGADLAPGVEQGANWTPDLERVDCTWCSASAWAQEAARQAADEADRVVALRVVAARAQAREALDRIRRGYPR